MSAFLYFGIVLLTFLGSPSSASPRCPQHLPQTQLMKHHGEYCYQFVKEERQWDSARDYCWRYGGWLTTVNSEDLNRFIVHTLNHMQEWRNSGVWIGLHDIDTESQWKWVSSDPNKHNRLNWSNWNRGEPSDGAGGSSDCARMVRENHWRWSATSCSSVWRTYRFICQYNELPLITTTAEPGVEAGLKAELSPKNDSKSSAAVSDVDETTEPLQPRASNRNVLKTVHVNSNSVETDNSHEANSAEQLVNEQGFVLSQVKQDTYSVQDAHANNTLLLLLVLCAVGFVCVTIVLAFILLRRRQKQQPKVSTIEGLANLSNGRIWRGPEGNDAARTPKRYTRCGSPAKAKCESSSKQTTSFMAVPTSEDTPTCHATGNDYIVNDYLVTQRGIGKKCVGEENAYLQPLEVCHSCGDECGGACAGAKSYGRDVADNLELTMEEHIYESIDEYEKRRSICADEENMNNERAIKA